MNTVQPPSLSDRRSFLGTLMMGLLFALGGCDTTAAFVKPDAAPGNDSACQVTACWQPNVMYTADTQHNGSQMPGIAGRVYLFGPEIGHPIVGEGSLIVGLYDATGPERSQAPAELEEWKIDPATLKRLVKQDVMGMGYTLFLPWNSFKPDIKHVVMKIRYDQPGKTSLFSESELTLDSANAAPKEMKQTVQPPAGS